MSNTSNNSPFTGIHWPTALSVGGVLITGFGIIAAVYMTMETKYHELQTAKLEDGQSKLEKLLGVEAELATEKERLRQMERSSTETKAKLDELLSQNFEQKFHAERLRSASLMSELESVKQSAFDGEFVGPPFSREMYDIGEKLKIVEKERDELKALYTKSKSSAGSPSSQKSTGETVRKPARQVVSAQQATSRSSLNGLKSALSMMTSADKARAIIAAVESAGRVSASDLADMTSMMVSSDKLTVITALAGKIERPISSGQMSALTNLMVSSDATKAVQVLTRGSVSR